MIEQTAVASTRACLPPGGTRLRSGRAAPVPVNIDNRAAPWRPQRCRPRPAEGEVASDVRVEALVNGILCTGAPQAEAVVAMLRRHLGAADTPDARQAIMARFEQALAGDPGWTALVEGFTRDTLDTALNRTGWSLLAEAIPGAAFVAAALGVLHHRSWRHMAAALPALAAHLPSLRSHAEFEALVQSLPSALRESIGALHDAVEHLDAPFASRVPVPPLAAVAAAVLLWQVQRALPPVRGPRHGLPAFIAALPRYWHRIAGLNRAGGALLAPVTPSVSLPQLTHVRTSGPGIVPAVRLPLAHAGSPHNGMASAASRNENALAALGVTLLTSGLCMIRQGWQLLTGGAPPAAVPPTAALRPVGEMIVLLDEIADLEGDGTIWQDIYAEVQNATRLDREALVDAVQARLVANDVIEQLHAVPDDDRPASGSSDVHLRVRRTPVTDHSPQVPHAGGGAATARPQEGRAAGEQLVDAAQALPPGPSNPEDVVIGNDERVSLAMARMHLRNWMRRQGSTTRRQHTALVTALKSLKDSDALLEQVGGTLPDLDRHITQQLIQQVHQASNLTVDPEAIYRNTFTEYPCWPEWEAHQVPGPDPAMHGWYGHYPRDRRIRSGLVSSHTLVEAAVLPMETDEARTGLYHSGLPGTYFPNEESALKLSQFNQAINGSDYIGSFRRHFDAFMSTCAGSGPHAERDAYVDALERRLAGTATLLYAMGQLGPDGDWLIRVLLRYPTRFGTGAGNSTLGRALALPGQDIRVNALAVQPAGGSSVPLYGVVLAQSRPSAERSKGAVLVISPSRLPLLEEFTSEADALKHLAKEVPHQLHSWVPAQLHARWSAGNGPVVLGASVDEHLLQGLLVQQLSLRSQRLNHTSAATAADTRKDYLALDRRLLALPPPVATSVLTAANERASSTQEDPYEILGVHWLVQMGVPSRGVLRNAQLEDARWLNSLSTTRGLLEFTYPLPARYVADRLEMALLNDTGVAIDTTTHFLIRFTGGTPSREATSGFVHDANQKVGACRLVECAFDKVKGYPDGGAGSAELGIYTSDNSTTYDKDTEASELRADQFISVARGLDLRTDYLAAVNDFWKVQRDEVIVCLRGVYMFSAWQQFAEGSLSARGLQLAIAATGYMLSPQAEDRGFKCHLADGSRASWVSIYGKQSTLMRIDRESTTEVLLYSPGDSIAFREFPDAGEMDAWLTRVVGSAKGKSWLEAMFDLADLQDGWFSNGVDTALGSPANDLFPGNSTGTVIEGDDLFDAMATRLQRRTVNDAMTLLSSNWSVWRDLLEKRLQQFDLVVGLVSLAFPALLPIVAVGSAAELGLGLEKAVDGRTQAERKEGATDAAWGAAGVALTVPFIEARTAALSTAEGARLVPAVQTVAEAGRADPLASLSARYAQPADLVVEGARPADNGIYHFAGRHYIRQSGTVYEVAFDKFNHTWRLKNPNPGNLYQNPVRLNAEGMWEPHSDVGLRGGAPESPYVSRSTSVDATYRNAVQVERLRSTQSLDSAGADFRWGMTHWERVVLPSAAREDASLRQMKELFVSGRLEPAQRGALSVIIARLERTMRLERTLRVEEAVATAVHAQDGLLYPVSQMMLESRDGMGWCTGMSRVMAVAMAEGQQGAVVKNLRLAMRRPGEGLGAEMLTAVRNAQGAALLPGAVSAYAPIEYTDLGRFLDSVKGSAQFFVTGSRHHMVAGVTHLANGAKFFELFDPNLGLIRFYKRSKFERLVGYLFSSRYFSALSRETDRAGRDTLGELYGATRASPHASASQFMIRQVDPEKLARQARARGWDRLLQDVPA